MKKVTIEGMACQHCVKAVTKALTKLGATDVDVSLEGGYAIANVSVDDATLKSAIEDADFKVLNIAEV